MQALLDEISQETELPARETELILLEIDPHRAHAYWNIDAASVDPGRPLVLRVHDITGDCDLASAHQSFDVEVQGRQGRWYLDFWRDDRTFISEIGYRNVDGTLERLALSNPVSTPPAEPFAENEANPHVDPHGRPLHTEWPGDQQPAPADDIAVDVEPPPVVPEPLVVEPVTVLNPDFPLPDWPSNAASASASEAGIPDEKRVEPPSETAVTAPAATGHADVDFPDTITAAGDAAVAFSGEEGTVDKPDGEAGAFPDADVLRDAVMENHDAVQAYYAAVAEFPAEAPVAPAPVVEPRDEAPASAAAASPSSPPVSAPLEQIVGLSSMESGNRDVLLEVNAELHIYGRAKPGTELSLYGQTVKTRPDGTFSVRRILPHGAVILPLLFKQGE
ncbi:MAG TPA: DUF4912 domain-containing protein [Kiritimatiellia bacterium]|nr:DUF4912 domain-containing protein [Kiritimatiellia bacterium]